MSRQSANAVRGKKSATAKIQGKKAKQHGPLSVCRSWIPYLFILFGVFVFTQEVHNIVTGVLFWFLVALPALTFLWAFLCNCLLTVEIRPNTWLMERRGELVYCIAIKNRCFLPIVHMEADVVLPAKDGYTVCRLRLTSTVLPFGESAVSERVTVPYHGRLPLGVDRVYVYDALRIFRFRRCFQKTQAVEILPRTVALTQVPPLPSQTYTGEAQKSKKGFERNEPNDVRVYQMGDAVRDIHWKLTARSEEIFVREYDRTSGQRFFVITDYSATFHQPEGAEKSVFADTIYHHAASGVAELSQAVCMRALEAGYDCYTVFRSSVDAKLEEFHISGEELHRAMFRRLTYQGPDASPTDVTQIALSVSEIHQSTICFVLSSLTEEYVKQLQRFTSLHTGQFLGQVMLYYYDCTPQVLTPEYQKRYQNYQLRLLHRLEHIMPVSCLCEEADGTLSFYNPCDFQET